VDNVNLGSVRETFGKVVYTHKTHEKAAEICTCKSNWVKKINIVLLSLTTGNALGAMFQGQPYLLLTAILSTLSLLFVVYQLSFNPEQEALNHKRTSARLWFIREQYQNLIADIMSQNLSIDDIVTRRDELLTELNKIIQDVPQTDKCAYERARKALKLQEEMTFNDKEIDSFLPKNLRLIE